MASKGAGRTCDCIGMVGDAGAGAEAVPVESTGKTDGKTSSL